MRGRLERAGTENFAPHNGEYQGRQGQPRRVAPPLRAVSLLQTIKLGLAQPAKPWGLQNPVVTRAAEDYRTRTGSLPLSAPFCPRVFLLSPDQSKRWLVGAVGIEPTTFGLKGRCSTTELRPSSGSNDSSLCGESPQHACSRGLPGRIGRSSQSRVVSDKSK